MGRAFDYVHDLVLNFRLNWCCWLAPVRIGLIITGYFYIILAVISLVGIADESFSPLLSQVQDTILDENAKKTAPMLAYVTDLAFNVILLTAIYRKDLTLMKVYMKYCIAAIVTSIMFYSMVVAAIGVVIAITLVLSIVVQGYVIILVRSMIVEMKLETKNMELPTLVMSTLLTEEKEKEKVEIDVEAPEETKSNDDKPDTRLETVDEHPKDEATNENK